MPSGLKHRVRARMAKTGESHQQALRHVRSEEREPAPPPAASVAERSRNVADTAFSIAAVRAEEARLPEADRLFEDPFAGLFAPAGAPVEEATRRFLDLPFFRDGVRLRTRFIDDAVREAIGDGLRQVVLLGAGFDARGLRMPELRGRGIRTFEVDTPAQLRRKRRILESAGVRVPRGVVYVPFDFDGAPLEAALGPIMAAKGFRRGAGAVFVWEGVIGYIDQAAIDASLRFMAREGGPGSRVVLTFAGSTFDPDTADAYVRKLGFNGAVELGGDALWRRHLTGEPPPVAAFIRVGVASV